MPALCCLPRSHTIPLMPCTEIPFSGYSILLLLRTLMKEVWVNMFAKWSFLQLPETGSSAADRFQDQLKMQTFREPLCSAIWGISCLFWWIACKRSMSWQGIVFGQANAINSILIQKNIQRLQEFLCCCRADTHTLCSYSVPSWHGVALIHLFLGL